MYQNSNILISQVKEIYIYLYLYLGFHIDWSAQVNMRKGTKLKSLSILNPIRYSNAAKDD